MARSSRLFIVITLLGFWVWTPAASAERVRSHDQRARKAAVVERHEAGRREGTRGARKVRARGPRKTRSDGHATARVGKHRPSAKKRAKRSVRRETTEAAATKPTEETVAANPPPAEEPAADSLATTNPTDAQPPEADGYAEAMAEGHKAVAATDFRRAVRAFGAAAKARPDDGQAKLHEGMAWYKLGDPDRAKDRLDDARARSLPREEGDLATTYSELVALARKQSGPQWLSFAAVGAGIDTNVMQTGMTRPDEVLSTSGTTTGSAFGTASLSLILRVPVSKATELKASYSFFQVAYHEPDYDDFSLQQHAGVLSLETLRDRRLRAGLLVRGDYAWTGLRTGLKPFQGTAAVEPFLVLREGDWASTRVAVQAALKQVPTEDLAFLAGQRLELSATQELRPWKLYASATVFRRYERLGTRRIDMDYVVRPVCLMCSGDYVIPFAYTADGASLYLSLRIFERLRLGATGRFEHRRYDGESYLDGTRPDGTTGRWNVRRRIDNRLSAGGSVAIGIMKWLELTARYDLGMAVSNFDNSIDDECTAPRYRCHSFDPSNRNYAAHVATLSLEGFWM